MSAPSRRPPSRAPAGTCGRGGPAGAARACPDPAVAPPARSPPAPATRRSGRRSGRAGRRPRPAQPRQRRRHATATVASERVGGAPFAEPAVAWRSSAFSVAVVATAAGSGAEGVGGDRLSESPAPGPGAVLLAHDQRALRAGEEEVLGGYAKRLAELAEQLLLGPKAWSILDSSG